MKNRFLVTILILLIATPVFGQLDRSIRPKGKAAPEIKIKEYKSFQLDNGLKVFVIESKKTPRVTFKMVFDYDPIFEGDIAGYTSITGSLLKRGTKTRTKIQLDEEIDFIGANLETTASGVSASALSKYKEKIVELMADVVLNADFKKEELEKLKTQTLSSLAAEKEDPSVISRKLSNMIVYGAKHPYGEFVTPETVEKITLEKCKEFYNTYYAPNIAYMAVVGDITTDEAKELITKYFSKWTKREVPKFNYKKVKAPLTRKVSLVDRSSAVQSVVAVTYPVKLKISDKDYIAVRVANEILGGSGTARLFLNLREDKAYTYGAYSRFSADELIGSFRASCQVKNVVSDSSITEILYEMKRMRNEKVTAEELQNTKNYLSGTFAMTLESPQTIASFALNIAINKLPKDYYNNYVKNINSLTLEDIQRVAKKYIKPAKAHVIVVGNGDEIGESLKKFSPGRKVTWYNLDGKKFDPSSKAIPEGVNAIDILKKSLEASGGKENILKLKDIKMVLEGEVQGMKMVVTTLKKEPNKFRTDVNIGPMVQKTIFDGKKCVMEGMGQKENIEGEDLEQMKAQNDIHAQINFEKNGYTYELQGIEKVEGHDAYKIKITMENGKSDTEYYDVKTYFMVKRITTDDTPQGQVTTTVIMGDYKKVENVFFPHKMVTQMGPMSVEMKCTTLEVNKGIKDSNFVIK